MKAGGWGESWQAKETWHKTIILIEVMRVLLNGSQIHINCPNFDTRHPERIGSVRQCLTGILSYRKTNKQRTSMIALSLHTVLFPFASPPLTHKGTANCKQNKEPTGPTHNEESFALHRVPFGVRAGACVRVCAQAKATWAGLTRGGRPSVPIRSTFAHKIEK